MTTDDSQLRRAAEALTRAIAPGPDDDAHLDEDVLDGLAAGTLDAADREWATVHLEACARCAEDLADRRSMQRAIEALAAVPPVAAPVRARTRTLAIRGGLAVAAGLLLAVVIGRQDTPVVEPGASSGAASADVLAADERALVSRVLATGRVELPEDIAYLQGHDGTLLGREEAAPRLTLDAPVGTAVSSRRPELRWSRVPDARTYTVRVFDETFREAARATVTTTAWLLDHDLAPGAVYVWQVTAHTRTEAITAPAPPLPEARFRVLPEADAARADGLRARLAADPLSLGILQAHLGLVDDASASLARAGRTAATRDQAERLRQSLPDSRRTVVLTGTQGAPTTTNPAQ